MNDTNERSDGSAGSVGVEPMAWAVMQPDSHSVFVSKRLAEKRQELCMGGDIIPLYRSHTLTDAEREAIHRLIEDYEQNSEPASERCVATLRGLLERTR